MARFSTDRNLYLSDEQKIWFGDSNDSSLWFDGVGMRVSTTLSGVDPTQSYHLTTKQFVDDAITTVSNSIITDHGDLTGLDDDDHTQYILVSGTRAFTGTVGGITPTLPAHLTTKQYVDSIASGVDWQESVLSIYDSGPPVSGTLGDRYIIGTSPGGPWVGNTNNIAEYNGVGWDITAANEGFAAWVEDEDVLYVYNGSTWVKFGTTVTHGNLLGLDADDHTQYILTTGARGFTGTVSGISPTASDHLTTKQYVDDAITTVSASIITDHGDLTGLSDDDHTQYILVDGTRAFTSTVSGVAPVEDAHLTTKQYVDDAITTISASIITDHGDLTGLADDDHTQYILVDGTRAFTSTVSGVAPIEDAHLTTKQYVDDAVATVTGTIITVHGDLTGLDADDHTQYILVNGTRGFTSTVSGVDPTESYHLSTKQYVDDEIATLSGSIITDHGDLTGLADDDHTQYILADGTRAFTGTVSGIDPTEDAHLTTKYYVDNMAGGAHKQGRTSIADDAYSVDVVFAAAFADTDYSISTLISNVVDAKPFIYPMIVTTKSGGGFTVEFSGKIKSVNYYLEWIAEHD